MDTINNMNNSNGTNTASSLNITKIDRASTEQMTTDELKVLLERELYDADKYREATDLKEENISTLINALKNNGETVETLLPE